VAETTAATEITAEAATASSLPESGRPRPGRPATLLAELFDAHAPLVLATCHGMLRDRHEAEDAAQQAFLSAYGSLLGGTFPRDPAAWLATIARNECRTRIQQQMRRPLPVADAYSETADPADQAARAAEVESLRRALAELPRRQRRAFVLREFGGLSYEELAVALGVTAPAVESLLFRARQRLRGSLRAAAAAAASLPAGIRDLFASGPTDGPVTVAKLASVGAGAAFLTAGATNLAPLTHHRAHAARAPAQRVVAAAPRREAQPRPAVARAAAAAVAAERESHREEVEHTAPAPRRHGDGDERAMRKPEPERRTGGPTQEASSESSGPDSSSGPSDTTVITVESSSDGGTSDGGNSGDGSTDSGTSGDSSSNGGGGPGPN
jgi:RNA polymerase sigma factor (sigma-70 family)